MRPELDHIGVVVEDMAAALAFYRLLGLDIPEGAEADDHVEITLRGGIRLAWDDAAMIRSFHPEFKAVNRAGRIGLSFLVDGPAEVDEVYARLTAAGYDSALKPFDAFWGQRYATVYDPDGNSVDLFAPL